LHSMIGSHDSEIIAKVAELFGERGLSPTTIKARVFPNGTIIVVELDADVVSSAIDIGQDIDNALPASHILVIRKAPPLETSMRPTTVSSVNDIRVSRLIELLSICSRTY
jgi:hypothetical protein